MSPATTYSGVAKIQHKSRARVSLASLAPGLTRLEPQTTRGNPPFFIKHAYDLFSGKSDSDNPLKKRLKCDKESH